MTELNITFTDIGKRFRRRDGEISTIDTVLDSGQHPVITLSRHTYDPQGHYYGPNTLDPLDLIERVEDFDVYNDLYHQVALAYIKGAATSSFYGEQLSIHAHNTARDYLTLFNRRKEAGTLLLEPEPTQRGLGVLTHDR